MIENAHESYPVARRGVKKIAKTAKNEHCKLQQAPKGCSTSDSSVADICVKWAVPGRNQTLFCHVFRLHYYIQSGSVVFISWFAFVVGFSRNGGIDHL